MPLPVVTVEGRLAAEPDLRFTPTGKAVCSFRMVSSDRKKNEETNQWEDTGVLWLRVTAWEQLGENAAESLEKGDLVIVTGKLQTRDYEDRDGNTRQSYELNAYQLGASLKFRSVPHGAGKAQRGEQRGERKPASADDPWGSAPAASADDIPPFHHSPRQDEYPF